MTRLIATALLLVFLGLAPRVDAAGKPIVRVVVQAHGPVLVGQQVTVTVQVLVPNYFLSAPDFPTLDMDDAIVTMPDEVLPHLSETIAGDSYVGVQKNYVIAPQQEGTLVLPSAEITFRYAAVPGQPPADGVVQLPHTTVVARLPEGARTDEGVLPVSKLTVRQTIEPTTASMKAGATLTRTIAVVAEHAQPMMILPPRIDAPDGVRVYRKDPVLTSDIGTRGEFLGGRRVDRVTYLFERPGTYTLPAIDYPWFDASTGTRVVAQAAAVSVSVAPNPVAAPVIPPEAAPAPAPAPPPSPWLVWKRRALWIAAALGVVLVGIWLFRLAWPRYRVWRSARALVRSQAESTYFARFERACGRDDAANAYATLTAWARHASGEPAAQWLASLGVPALDAEIRQLESRLFAGAPVDTQWSGRRLRDAAAAAREAWRSASADGPRRAGFLPPMNPGWGKAQWLPPRPPV